MIVIVQLLPDIFYSWFSKTFKKMLNGRTGRTGRTTRNDRNYRAGRMATDKIDQTGRQKWQAEVAGRTDHLIELTSSLMTETFSLV